tara:strand:+ start:191 stop:421 length:231 start_codon:yes stop_codon:yes gene_type:complete
MSKLLSIALALFKFFVFSLAGTVLITGGTYTTWGYYVSDSQVHWLFSFCGPLLIVAGIGMIATMTTIFNEEMRNAN